ncbi:MAG: SDR family NAD(P)-dependent oxidoreductase [Chloroflexota bacterium]|nr:SDR family NAD(P)-dependent oxidoreductase [Chloroflexota bacterium]MDE2894791.1 SDR family NAD(P)-dependent oxidoreductase [Chloroflexota bacterium]
MQEFAGKTAVVTGAASGMGLSMSRRFAAEGMNVVLADIEEAALRTQVALLEREGCAVLGVTVDTMQRADLEQLRDRAVDRFGNIHILCNNAGVTGLDDAVGVIGGVNMTWDVPQHTWEWVMGVNFWGVLYGIQAFVPHMLAHGEAGHIVNTSSLAGLLPGGSAYSVSKHAVLALTEGLYQQFEHIGANLSASALCPGVVRTNLHRAERNRPEDLGERLMDVSAEMAETIEGFMATALDPEDIAELVLFAIREKRCYILPHVDEDDSIRGRTEHVLGRRAPFPVAL